MSGVGQLARFTVVAGVNLGVNLLVLALGVHVLALPARVGTVGLWIAQAAAVLVATSLGYVLHARFTFTNARRVEGIGRMSRYAGVAGLALAIQVPLFAANMAVLGWFFPGAASLPYVANLLGGVMVFFGNFVLHRVWTFQAHSGVAR